MKRLLFKKSDVQKFNSSNLSVLAYANNFTMWHYKAEDVSLETICSEGFFNEAHEMLRKGDMIVVNAENGNDVFWVLHNEDGKATIA